MFNNDQILAKTRQEIVKSIISSVVNGESEDIHTTEEEFQKAIETHNLEVYPEANYLQFRKDLRDKFFSNQVTNEEIEKARKDISKLKKVFITDKNGDRRTVYVKQGETPVERKGYKSHTKDDVDEIKATIARQKALLSNPKSPVGAKRRAQEIIAQEEKKLARIEKKTPIDEPSAKQEAKSESATIREKDTSARHSISSSENKPSDRSTNARFKPGSKVVITSGPKDVIGKIGYIGEVHRGLTKHNRSYVVDYTDDNGYKSSIQLNKNQIKNHRESVDEPSAKQEAKDHATTHAKIKQDVKEDGKLDMTKKELGESIREDHEEKDKIKFDPLKAKIKIDRKYTNKFKDLYVEDIIVNGITIGRYEKRQEYYHSLKNGVRSNLRDKIGNAYELSWDRENLKKLTGFDDIKIGSVSRRKDGDFLSDYPDLSWGYKGPKRPSIALIGESLINIVNSRKKNDSENKTSTEDLAHSLLKEYKVKRKDRNTISFELGDDKYEFKAGSSLLDHFTDPNSNPDLFEEGGEGLMESVKNSIKYNLEDYQELYKNGEILDKNNGEYGKDEFVVKNTGDQLENDKKKTIIHPVYGEIPAEDNGINDNWSDNVVAKYFSLGKEQEMKIRADGIFDGEGKLAARSLKELKQKWSWPGARIRFNPDLSKMDLSKIKTKIHAHGFKGERLEPWKKTFSSVEEMNKWAKENEADIHDYKEQ